MVTAVATAIHVEKSIEWVIYKNRKRVIGTIGFQVWSPQHSHIEIGYEVHLDYWRKGYILEV
ncbi:GNAT family N-acetyltransferase [Bacillus atrophaeus]|uniref:GNAT family N-acetyltransferase n=1 Tax=Bacillus atrophaeus TaxID=1452 RepID=UPI0009C18184